MIRYRDKILEDYSIDPVTAVITNSQGEVQETKIEKDGRPCFHCMPIHRIQIHTHLGYKPGYDIHHLDESKMNNALSNLVYLTQNEHMKIHKKGEKHPLYGKHHSEETKQKISVANKGKHYKWINNSLEQRYIPFDEEIPEGFVRGSLKLSEETRKKMSASMKGKNKDKIWINNNVEEKFIPLDEEIPEGFVRGRLKRY